MSAPAFPVEVATRQANGELTVTRHLGLSQRQWFAGRAMQGLLASGISAELSYYDIRTRAYAMADEMLAEIDQSGAYPKVTP